MMKIDEERLKKCTNTSYDYITGKYIFGTLGNLFARIFIKLPFTPNQITWFWGGLMVLSSLLYSTGDYIYGIMAGAIWIIAYAMDYSDGIVARYKEITSARGGYLDMIVHRVTYPLLMFCIGYGVFVSGGSSWITSDWFDDSFYIYFGIASGISMSVFMDVMPLYNRFKIGNTDFVDGEGSEGVEGQLFKNQSLFKKLMNFNPLVFTNMMIMLLVFALLDQMGIFIIIYGIGYSLVTAARIIMLYIDL